MKPQPPVKSMGANPVLTTFLLLAGIPVFLGLVLMVSGCELSFGGTSFNYTGEKVDRSESGEIGESVEAVQVANRYGNVIVTEGAEPGWSWALSTWGDDVEIAQQYSDLIKLEVSERDGVQSFELLLPDELSDCNGIKSHVTVTVPASFEADIENAHGNTEVTGLQGRLGIDSAHGDIEVTACSENRIDSRHGTVKVSGVAATSIHSRHGNVTINDAVGDVECDVQHGSIRVDGAASLIVNSGHADVDASRVAGSVEVDARHGDVNVQCSGESIVASNAHGDVSFTVESMDLKKIVVDNAHGDITLRLPEEMQINIDASASHGDVICDFESTSNADVQVVLETSHDDIHVMQHTITLPASETTPSESD